MTLQALRNKVGDPAFFRILRQLGRNTSGGNGTTLGVHRPRRAGSRAGSSTTCSRSWLFTPGKPPFSEPSGATASPKAQQRSLTACGYRDTVRDRLKRVGRY